MAQTHIIMSEMESLRKVKLSQLMCEEIQKCQRRPKKCSTLARSLDCTKSWTVLLPKQKLRKVWPSIDLKEKNNEVAHAIEKFAYSKKLNNVEIKVVDFSMMKATDMKFNRRLCAPNAAPDNL